MEVPYSEIEKSARIIIWGTGYMLERYYEMLDPRLNIIAFCDTCPEKWCESYKGGVPCIDKNLLTCKDAVLITMSDKETIHIVSREMDEKGIRYCHITEAVQAYLLQQDERTVESMKDTWEEGAFEKGKIMRYVDFLVPGSKCNLKCDYCYIRQKGDWEERKPVLHSPGFIRTAISQKRLGGQATVVFCGMGETLLCPGIVPIIKEIVDEGHYVQIVTNGTVTKAIDELLKCGTDLSRIFFKFSFHYMEFKRLGLLEQFAGNVNRVWDAGCSITLELVPEDKMIPYIPEIKKFSLEHFGALPHCTVPRDDLSKELKVFTNMDIKEFEKTWGEFDSPLFAYKMATIYPPKRYKDCRAGLYSFHCDLETGDTYKCQRGNPWFCNLYKNLEEPIPFEAIGSHCCQPYCFNCHSFLAWGFVPEAPAPTYYEMRDRKTTDGRHWVQDAMKSVFMQKLYDNHSDCETDQK